MSIKTYTFKKVDREFALTLNSAPDNGGARLVLISAPYLSCFVDLSGALKENVRIVYLDSYSINGRVLNPLELSEDEIQEAVLLLEQAFKDFHFGYSAKAVHYQPINNFNGYVLYTRYGHPITDKNPRMYRARLNV